MRCWKKRKVAINNTNYNKLLNIIMLNPGDVSSGSKSDQTLKKTTGGGVTFTQSWVETGEE